MSKDQNPSKVSIRSMEECAVEEKHPTEACVSGEARGGSVLWKPWQKASSRGGKVSSDDVTSGQRKSEKQPLSLPTGGY